MPNLITANATTRRFLDEQVRPLAEQIRQIYAAGIAINITIETLLDELLAIGAVTIDDQTGEIVAEDPSEVIVDGRSVEGVTQITTGDLAAILNTLGGVMQTIADEHEIQAALERACVRKLAQG